MRYIDPVWKDVALRALIAVPLYTVFVWSVMKAVDEYHEDKLATELRIVVLEVQLKDVSSRLARHEKRLNSHADRLWLQSDAGAP